MLYDVYVQSIVILMRNSKVMLQTNFIKHWLA